MTVYSVPEGLVNINTERGGESYERGAVCENTSQSIDFRHFFLPLLPDEKLIFSPNRGDRSI